MEYELFEDKDKPHKKKKLHELLDKYGTIEELEQHGSVEDNLEYMFSGQRELLDEVLEERRENTGLKAENENYDEAENLTEKRQKTAVNLQKKLLEDDEQEKQKSGAHETLPATSRSSLDDEDMAKNAAKHPMYQIPSDREVESLRARSLADRVKENQSAENDRTETKSDEENEEYNNFKTNKQRSDKIFERVLARTLGEEGGYENRKKRIDQSTNMGIRQSTLNSFKKLYPRDAVNFPKSVVNLTRSQVSKIARMVFFDKYRIAEIHNESLQETMFDAFYNHSPEEPALWAQRAINKITGANIKEDGIFGTETIGALNSLNAKEIKGVNNAIIDMRLDDYEQEKKTNQNPYYKDYTKGLSSRFEKFRIK